MKYLSGLTLLMVGVIASPVGAALAVDASMATQAPMLISRGGGGGGRMGGGGGGARVGGGGLGRAGGGGSLGRTGFQGSGGAGGLNRGVSRPAGGWSSGVAGGLGGPSINRPVARPGGVVGNPGLNRAVGTGSLNRNVNRNINRNVNVNRNWNRAVNVNAIGVRPGWARPGWGVARPWNHGWYGGWATPSWGWWGASAAAWGVGTLATAAIINSAVDAAVASSQTVIVVPNTQYELLFGTVQPTGTATVAFDVSANGSVYQLSADCQSGLLNGQVPGNAQEAELLNAACQVAFGTAS
ncbi:hypothetical protein [Cyanobium sp. N5-Cardenillas]|uniref:hypothetical protein n=1 Tax=Cyanobium sp. N5-Cardenillas TaxID=2823720 RepID=UPI0020CDA219|nr:hypothetical protein [Cyanobium sp. N5-Cardenillas]MCP9785741.1 hypothetical protein [Cyanobium sp. N5-Cardenillas]